MMTMTTIM
ncbi:Protein of unknown function [Bacillus wiedmannii]|uniref:Uncharacterized protein n=1 Tax=Bacillus wiedmannii TaxID=1890302 RepID=A0AB37YS12_9BACI|nr:Protein of unknown function [Bacillus wiedmannii]SCN03552.1 Protein of unknown function [Bacillus wiedmannii]SCN43990.1 Protein of unknown function [Bacillus wiedmannii]